MNNDDCLRQELEALRKEVVTLRNEREAFKAQRVMLESLVTIAKNPDTGEGMVLRSALQTTLDISADLTDSEKGSLFLFDTSSGKVIDAILTRTEVTPEKRDQLIKSVSDKGLAGWVTRNRELGLITDTKTDPRWLQLEDQPYTVRSALAVPILRKQELLGEQELLGILTLLHSEAAHFSHEAAARVQATAEQIAVVLENAGLYSQLNRTTEALNNELEKGRKIQIDFLPYEIPKLPEWEISTCFHPARQVAGDFYDAFEIPESGLGLVIADVCDKGVGAALFMALFRSLIRIFSAQTKLQGEASQILKEHEPKEGWVGKSATINLAHVNALHSVCLTNEYVAQKHWQMSMFATLFFGVLDPATGVLSYVNGGHEPLFVINESQIRATLNPTGPAVGMMPNMQFKVEQILLQPGDILFGYTDGVTECKSPHGELFTTPRLVELLEATPKNASASGLLESIKSTLFEYMDDAEQFDDITMLAVHWLAATKSI